MKNLMVNLKTLNLSTDLPYLARISNDYNDFIIHWEAERLKLERLAGDVFYKFNNDCKNIVDIMNVTNKIEFYKHHTE